MLEYQRPSKDILQPYGGVNAGDLRRVDAGIAIDTRTEVVGVGDDHDREGGFLGCDHAGEPMKSINYDIAALDTADDWRVVAVRSAEGFRLVIPRDPKDFARMADNQVGYGYLGDRGFHEMHYTRVFLASQAYCELWKKPYKSICKLNG